MSLWLFINKLHRHSSIEYRRQRYINNSFREYLCKEFDKEKGMRYSLTFQSFAISSLVSSVIHLMSFCHYVFLISTFRLLFLLSFYPLSFYHYVFSINTLCLLFILSFYLLSIMSLCLFNKRIMSSPIILSSVLLSWFANMNYFRYLCLQNKRKNKWQQ